MTFLSNFIMGQSSSQANNLSLHRWQLVSQVPGRYLIVRDKSGRQGQQYLLPLLPSMRPEQQFAIYRTRKSTPLPIVHIYGAQFTEPQSAFSRPTAMRVISEHLQLRIHNIKVSTSVEALYFAREMVRGYSYLFDNVGCMSIRAQMIGLTSEGELRVWMHMNFAINRPQYPKKSLPGVKFSQKGVSEEQKFMVAQIVQLLRQQCDRTVYLRTFGSRLENVQSFSQAQRIIYNIMSERNERGVTRIDFARRQTSKW